MSNVQTYETFLRGQAEKAQYGVVIIPARTALDMADFIERMRANGTDITVGSTISRQAAIDFIDAGRLGNPNEPRWSDNEVVNFLKRRPSVQPEIIRCKDCKYYKYGICMKIGANKSFYGFCDWAERGEQNE